jgi:hypothetical protein
MGRRLADDAHSLKLFALAGLLALIAAVCAPYVCGADGNKVAKSHPLMVGTTASQFAFSIPSGPKAPL